MANHATPGCFGVKLRGEARLVGEVENFFSISHQVDVVHVLDSGCQPPKDYWRPGTIFGALFLIFFLAVGVPWASLLWEN